MSDDQSEKEVDGTGESAARVGTEKLNVEALYGHSPQKTARYETKC